MIPIHYRVLMQIVWSSRAVIYSTKYTVISANDNPDDIIVLPVGKNGFPVRNPYTTPKILSTSITNVKIANSLKYKQYDFGRGP